MDDDDQLDKILGDNTPDSSQQASEVQDASEQSSAVQNTNMEEAIMYAKKYIEDLLSFFGLNTDVYATTEDGEVIELDVPSTHLNGFLIGHNGDTVRALQYTISNALKNQNFSHTRVNVDVAEYKKQRGERLAKTAEEWFKEVRDSGKPKELQPMNAADRRVVHQAATDYGLTTESVGFGRDRHIVLKPAAGAKDSPANEE
jgi:spoIIIJ-associated protein